MASTPVPALDSTMGATYIGVLIAATLYGVTCLQTLHYYTTYGDDPWHLKALVAATWVTDTLHQILISHTVYTYLITNYFNPPYLNQLVWSIIVEVIISGITALLVQTFFTLRIYTLSNKNIPLTVGVYLLVLGQFGVTMAYSTKALEISTFTQLTSLKALSMSINAFTAASDVCIAATLCLMLHKSRTGFKRSDTMINRLILFTVNTGLLTSIDAVCSLISIAASPNTFIYICFFFTLGRLYTNSLLATLNARKSIRGKASNDESMSLSLQGVQRSADLNTMGKNAQSNHMAIRIDTHQEFARDQDSTKDVKSDIPVL